MTIHFIRIVSVSHNFNIITNRVFRSNGDKLNRIRLTSNSTTAFLPRTLWNVMIFAINHNVIQQSVFRCCVTGFVYRLESNVSYPMCNRIMNLVSASKTTSAVPTIPMAQGVRRTGVQGPRARQVSLATPPYSLLEGARVFIALGRFMA